MASPQTVDVASRALYHATRRTFESDDGRGWKPLATPEEAASLTTTFAVAFLIGRFSGPELIVFEQILGFSFQALLSLAGCLQAFSF